MKTTRLFSIIVLMMVFAVGCNKQDEPNNGGNNEYNDSNIKVTTYTPQEITQRTALCGGDVIVTQGLSLNKLGICWSKELNPTIEDAHLFTTNWREPYVCTIENLEIGVTYHVRAFALRGLEYYYGEDKSFTTEASHVNEIRVTTYTPHDITQTSAVCGGDVIVEQGLSPNRLGVCWSKESNPTEEDACLFTTNWSEPFVCTITGLEPGNTYHVRAFVVYDAECYYGENITFATNSIGGIYNEHEYIDLGLPSGLLWATCNVGANRPQEYGYYFAWGEIQTKEEYNWNNYKYFRGSELYITKYNTDPDNGYVDNRTVLLSADDAATANWGFGWRMPTKEEWEELLQNTTKTSDILNGVEVTCFRGANGAILYLPEAGYRSGHYLCDDGSVCLYWSSSLSTYLTHDAYAIESSYMSGIGFYSPSIREIGRDCGCSVRPVHPAE